MKLPLLEARKLVKILEGQGYTKARQRGSHAQYEKNGNVVTVPIHHGKPVGRGILRKIMRDMELSHDEFIKLVEAL